MRVLERNVVNLRHLDVFLPFQSSGLTPSARQFDQLFARFGCILYDSMDVCVSCIVPDSLALQVHAECMSTLFEMGVCMLPFIPSTPHFATYQTLPQTRVNMAYFAFKGPVVDFVFVRIHALEFGRTKTRRKVVVSISADWTSTTRPFLEARAVKYVLAGNSQKTSRFVHAFQADRAGRQFDKGGCSWG